MRRAILKAWLLLFGTFILGFACGQAVAEPTVEPVVEIEHVSDLLRGKAPWAIDEPEPFHDHVMAGVTITIGKRARFEIDFLHGWKRLSGTAGMGRTQTGSTARMRWYPRRNR